MVVVVAANRSGANGPRGRGSTTFVDIIVGMAAEIIEDHRATLAPDQQMDYLQQRFSETGLLPPELGADRILSEIEPYVPVLASRSRQCLLDVDPIHY